MLDTNELMLEKTNLPILYSFRRCPYAMRARMAVAISEVTVELREVVLRDKPPELIAASAKATVPVLVQIDGTVIEESLDIMRWALAQNDPEGWLSRINTEWIEANDGPFKHALDRYKYPQRYGLLDGIKYRDAGLAHLAKLDEALGNDGFVGGTQRGFTDIALVPFIRQFAAIDPTWFGAQPLRSVHSWLEVLVESDLFARIIARYPRWTVNSQRTLYP